MCLSGSGPIMKWVAMPGQPSRYERRAFTVDPVPIDLAGVLNQLVLHVDDLVQPVPEQIRSDPVVLCCFGRIATSDATTES